jgi:hypothetical protein
MSAQPVPIDKQQEEVKRRRRAEFRSDALYVAGALLVTAGMAMIRIRWGFIAAGLFCMLLPLLELATGFIRGLKAPAPRAPRLH